MKKKIFQLIAISILVFGSWYIMTGEKSKEKIKINSEKSSSPIEEASFTARELQEYYEVYKNPFVIATRNRFNDYLAGNYKLILDKEAGELKGNSTGMDSFDKSYYESRFTVASIDDFPAGGKEIILISKDKPDKLFHTWIYKLSDGNYELRGFWQDNGFDGKKMEQVRQRYNKFLNDTEHSL